MADADDIRVAPWDDEGSRSFGARDGNLGTAVRSIDPHTFAVVRVWKSASAAAEAIGVTGTMLQSALDGGRQLGGSYWVRLADPLPDSAFYAGRGPAGEGAGGRGVFQIDPATGEPEREWASAVDAAQEIGCPPASITAAVGTGVPFAGYRWEDAIDLPEPGAFPRPVDMIDPLTRGVLRTYPDLAAACSQFGIAPKVLHRAICDGRRCSGFLWGYSGDASCPAVRSTKRTGSDLIG